MSVRNIGRRPRPYRSASMRKAARIGPPTADGPRAGAKTLKAEPSRSRGTTAPRMPNPGGINSAPNAPCTSRATTMESRGRRREAGDTGQEEAAPSVPVTKAAADDQGDTERGGVPGTQPLDEGLTSVQIRQDGKRGDVGDGAVEEVEHGGCEDDGDETAHRCPSEAVGAARASENMGIPF
ncbi:hypothetical protein ABZV31_29215 [Streptomyces sp. NPDC005202]|uniref:hypothetical protein n=1 Tax=Streptomyces sp. NPDC005202 TaxID=3157021 RepID=UPI0033ABF4B1